METWLLGRRTCVAGGQQKLRTSDGKGQKRSNREVRKPKKTGPASKTTHAASLTSSASLTPKKR